MSNQVLEKIADFAIEELEIANNIYHVAQGVWRLKDKFVNVFLIQNNKNSDWVLVDAGLPGSAQKIKQMIAEVISPGAIPSAIILTHGHFDHRGSLEELAEEWQIPVYAHHMELPYLNGKSSYPPADPTVGGGALASLSFTYPNKPINIEKHLKELPEDGTIPELKGWSWIHTPGHTPGHISLFRKKDKVLIAGDACVTTKQESIYFVMTQKRIVSSPPKYFTPDWRSAAHSVRELASLEPEVLVSGHGAAMYGKEAKKGLHKLSVFFYKLGIPKTGRYVDDPALFDEEGVTYVPPRPTNYTLWFTATIAAVGTLGLSLYLFSRNKK